MHHEKRGLAHGFADGCIAAIHTRVLLSVPGCGGDRGRHRSMLRKVTARLSQSFSCLFAQTATASRPNRSDLSFQLSHGRTVTHSVALQSERTATNSPPENHLLCPITLPNVVFPFPYRTSHSFALPSLHHEHISHAPTVDHSNPLSETTSPNLYRLSHCI